MLTKDTEKEAKPQGKLARFNGCITTILWLAMIAFFGQNAWASVYENEIRAGIIYGGFTLILVFGGIIVSISRKLDL